MTMRALRPSAGFLGIAAFGLVACIAHAQQPTTPSNPDTPKTAPNLKYGVNFETKVGSFKIKSGVHPATGKLKMDFTGTVLVSGLEPNTKVTVSPGIRREIHDTKHNKTVYHGTGTLTFDGAARAIQWFGKNMKARFQGEAIIMLYGEFDSKFNTGTYKYDNIDRVNPWGTGGSTISVPNKDQVIFAPKVVINPDSGN